MPWIIAATNDVMEHARKKNLKEASTSKVEHVRIIHDDSDNLFITLEEESDESEEESVGSEDGYVMLNEDE